MVEKPPLRAAMLQLAARQHGHLTRRQLLALGATPRWIESQLAQQLLIAVHAGVYALGHVPRHAHCRAMAAVLACGEGAVLSHSSALALWDGGDWSARLEVSSSGYHRRPGLATHRTCTLREGDAQVRHGIPVTSPARTVLDMQARLGDPRLIRVINDLRVAGHLRARAFEELCRRSSRVERVLGDGGLTRSVLEDLFRAFVVRHRLTMPEINAQLRIGDTVREVDALYRGAQLIIELDSWRFHGDRVSFERDRAKDALALAHGWQTLRSTERRLRQSGADEAATIRRILGA